MPVYRTNKLRWLISQAAPADPGPADYYVAPAGVASGSGVGSYLDPYTWEQAFAQAGAGLVFEYRPGTYEAPNTNTDRIPTHLPQPGSLGAENVHRAQYRAPLTVDSNQWARWRLSAGTGPVCGMANYVVFDGFDVAQAGTHVITSEGHAIALWNVTGVAIRYCRFNAELTYLDSNNNWGAIYGEDATSIEVSDCEFIGFNGTTHHNHSAVMFYDTDTYDIHHCLFDTCAGAVFPKGVHSGADPDLLPGSIHHCHMTDVSNPLPLGGIGQNTAASAPNCDFYQNLVVRCGMISTRAHPRNTRIVNNTFVDPVVNEALFYTPLSYTVTDATPVFNYSMFVNNLVVDPSTGGLWDDYDAAATLAILAARMTFDRNMYRGVTGYHKGGSWATWTAAGMDPNGAQGDPLFENEVGEDFRLAVLSPALGTGSDVLGLAGGGSINLGCYVLPDQSDAIGVRAA